MHSFLRLLKNNAKRGEFAVNGQTILLYDVIVGSDEEADWFGGVSAPAFLRALNAMSGPVTLRINSPGGDVFAAVAMAQAMGEYPDQITVMVDGVAASAATYLAIAGARTVMAPGAFMMIHRAASGAWGTGDDMRQCADKLDKVDASIAARYAAKGNKDQAAFAEMMDAETWLTAEECVDLGFADEISTASQRASNRFDLSAFNAVPGALAVPAQIAPAKPEPSPEQPANEAPAPEPFDIERLRRQTAVRLLSPA